MNVHRTRLGAVALLAGAAASIHSVGAAPFASSARADGVVEVGEVNGTTLYLQTGPVDTSQARRGLGTFITTERAKANGALAGRHFVIQLDGPMRPAWRDRLVHAGIEVGDYLPMNAFIATLDRADPKAVDALEFVRWFDDYRAAWKLAPGVGQRPFQTPERLELDAAGQSLIIVTLFRGRAPDEVIGHLAALAGAQAHWVQPIGDNLCVSATLAKGDIAGLATLATVQFVEDAPELTVRNDTDRWIVQSNVVNSTPLYTQGIHGEGQVLGLLDTRLDRNHCSFVDSQPIGPLHRKILAYNATQGAEFHGTHVAGTAVGDHSDLTATRGIAYLAKLVYNSIPSFNETDVQNRLNLHHTQGARLHTNSWGDDSTTQYNSLCRGIDAFSYNNEDDLILFAVTNQSLLKNPENAKNLVAVGASQDTPLQANHCSGGNGPTSDQRRKPEIYAPGCNTNSASANTSCSVGGATGTSMACPAVTGTGMLVRQYFVDGFYPSGTRRTEDSMVPSGALIKATLLNSAVDMTGIAGYPSTLEGWGRVLADDALYFDGDQRRLSIVDVRNAGGLSTGDVIEYPLVILGSEQKLKVTLVWTEPAAASGAAFASINDLDLEVVAPDGSLYKGNFFSAGQSATGGTRDDRNNVEQVHLNTPSAGTYTVRVRGTGINQGTQGYAIAMTGNVFTPGAGISVQLATTLPPAIPGGQTFPLQVTIDPGADTLVAGSPTLHFRFQDGAFQSVPLTFVEGMTWAAELPAPSCGDLPEFYFSAEGVETGLRSAPPGGASAPYAVAVGDAVVSFQDDMETNTGWTVGAPGDTAVRGVWIRVTPNAGTGVPDSDHSTAGTMCFVTGQESSFGGGDRNDVDGGATTLTSPRFDLSGDVSAVVSYWRWYSNVGGGDPQNDTLVVQVSADGGATWVLLEEVGPAGGDAVGGWIQHQAALEQFIPLTADVHLRIVAQDTGTDSNIEAGLDDVRIDAVHCVNAPTCPCDWNADALLNSQDFFDYVAVFFAGTGDFNQNGRVDSQDFFDFLTCFFAGCP